MNWSKLSELIGTLGRCCLHCGSYKVRKSLFCAQCENHLWARHQGSLFVIEKMKVEGRCLFVWNQDEDRQVSKLVVTLKEGKPLEAYEYYAQKLFLFDSNVKLKSGSVLVPCASTPGRRHALVLAQCLGELLDLPVLDILSWKSRPGKQKTKAASQRKSIEFHATKLTLGRHVIFIDDILTTGATAFAARKALVGCVGFEAWCIARRGLVAEQQSIFSAGNGAKELCLEGP